MARDENGKIKVLDKAFTIIGVLIDSPKPIGVNEIAKLTDIHPATVHRILQTLKTNGWVYQDIYDKYLLGYRIFGLFHKNDLYTVLKEVAYCVMRELTDSESRAINLAVRNYHKCFILQQTRTERLIDYVPPIGSELPIYASACGEILLSELPQSILMDIIQLIDFKPLTQHTITQKNVFLKELEEVRARGYALDIHESLEEGCCVAVPIRDENGSIIAALSFSGFIGTLEEKDIQYYVGLLNNASRKISQRLFDYRKEQVDQKKSESYKATVDGKFGP